MILIGTWRDLCGGRTVASSIGEPRWRKGHWCRRRAACVLERFGGTEGSLVIEVEPREPPQCPHYGAISTSRHGAYIRTLRDLPIQGDAVTLRVHVGRWRCRSSSCVRRTFFAPLTALAYARQRRTRRLDNVAFLIGHGMGGRPGERLARRLGVPVSRDVIRRFSNHTQSKWQAYSSSAHRCAPTAARRKNRWANDRRDNLLGRFEFKLFKPNSHSRSAGTTDRLPCPASQADVFPERVSLESRLAIAFSTMREPRSAAMMIASHQCQRNSRSNAPSPAYAKIRPQMVQRMRQASVQCLRWIVPPHSTCK
jgi:zinc-finger of transposase IS204/IS1001/IS1096/IS1165